LKMSNGREAIWLSWMYLFVWQFGENAVRHIIRGRAGEET